MRLLRQPGPRLSGRRRSNKSRIEGRLDPPAVPFFRLFFPLRALRLFYFFVRVEVSVLLALRLAAGFYALRPRCQIAMNLCMDIEISQRITSILNHPGDPLTFHPARN